jgi:6,7-dimethyl-8-ribityllumazine synthase
VARSYQLPVTFGVLTTNTYEQAEARAGGSHSDTGRSAALTAIQTAKLLQSL